MNIDLKEIRKMVTTALIQERVGYYGNQVEGDAGQPSEPPAIDDLVDEAQEQISNLEMSKTNVAQAAVAKATGDLVGPLVQAKIKPAEIKTMLQNFYAEMMRKIEQSKAQEKEDEEALRADIDTSSATKIPPPATIAPAPMTVPRSPTTGRTTGE